MIVKFPSREDKEIACYIIIYTRRNNIYVYIARRDEFCNAVSCIDLRLYTRMPARPYIFYLFSENIYIYTGLFFLIARAKKKHVFNDYNDARACIIIFKFSFEQTNLLVYGVYRCLTLQISIFKTDTFLRSV